MISKLLVTFIFSSFLLLFISSCNNNPKKIEVKNDYVRIYEDQIRRMEMLIPNSVFNSDFVAIWRSGSIYFSEYLSVLIIEKKQLGDDQLLCNYISFDSDKYSNYRNWKFCNVYELTINNTPFKLPLVDKIRIEALDTLSYTYGEGIKANNYFLLDFKSDIVYPISEVYNSELIDNIVKLFSQISKREYVQTLSLSRDSISYAEVNKIVKDSNSNYAIKMDREVNRIQRLYGDK